MGFLQQFSDNKIELMNRRRNYVTEASEDHQVFQSPLLS